MIPEIKTLLYATDLRKNSFFAFAVDMRPKTILRRA